MNKTIRVNPNHFMMQHTRQRKSKSTEGSAESAAEKEEQKAAKIKIKMASQEQTQRERLIKLMLKQQEKNFKQRDRLSTQPSPQPLGKVSEFNTSLDHLLSIVEEVENKKHAQPTPTTHHSTLKNYQRTDPNVSTIFPDEVVSDTFLQCPTPTETPLQLHTPKYGCLRYGGKLPTYREYKRQITQKNLTTDQQQTSELDGQRAFAQRGLQQLTQKVASLPDEYGFIAKTYGLDIVNNPTNEKKYKEMDVYNDDVEPTKPFPTPNLVAAKSIPTKQRKLLRRTFKVGKSPVLHRVSVLLSNQTLRKRVNNRKTELKYTPMNEIKTFLIRRGLIKIGTIAPNNVLRQMYEDAMLTCGEIYNHNPEVLLFNFMNQ